MPEILIHTIAGSECPLAWQGRVPHVSVAVAALTSGAPLVLGITDKAAGQLLAAMKAQGFLAGYEIAHHTDDLEAERGEQQHSALLI